MNINLTTPLWNLNENNLKKDWKYNIYKLINDITIFDIRYSDSSRERLFIFSNKKSHGYGLSNGEFSITLSWLNGRYTLMSRFNSRPRLKSELNRITEVYTLQDLIDCYDIIKYCEQIGNIIVDNTESIHQIKKKIALKKKVMAELECRPFDGKSYLEAAEDFAIRSNTVFTNSTCGQLSILQQ